MKDGKNVDRNILIAIIIMMRMINAAFHTGAVLVDRNKWIEGKKEEMWNVN